MSATARTHWAARRVVAGDSAWSFELDCRSGGGVTVVLDGGPVRLRTLGWREKVTLARFAELGAEVVEEQMLRLTVETGDVPPPGDARAALLSLAMWLESPGDDALALRPELLAAVTLDVCAAIGVAPSDLDDRDAADVTALWRATSGSRRAPQERPAGAGTARAGDADAPFGDDGGDWTQIRFVDDITPAAGAPAQTAGVAPPSAGAAPQAASVTPPSAGAAPQATATVPQAAAAVPQPVGVSPRAGAVAGEPGGVAPAPAPGQVAEPDRDVAASAFAPSDADPSLDGGAVRATAAPPSRGPGGAEDRSRRAAQRGSATAPAATRDAAAPPTWDAAAASTPVTAAPPTLDAAAATPDARRNGWPQIEFVPQRARTRADRSPGRAGASVAVRRVDVAEPAAALAPATIPAAAPAPAAPSSPVAIAAPPPRAPSAPLAAPAPPTAAARPLRASSPRRPDVGATATAIETATATPPAPATAPEIAPPRIVRPLPGAAAGRVDADDLLRELSERIARAAGELGIAEA